MEPICGGFNCQLGSVSGEAPRVMGWKRSHLENLLRQGRMDEFKSECARFKAEENA